MPKAFCWAQVKSFDGATSAHVAAATNIIRVKPFMPNIEKIASVLDMQTADVHHRYKPTFWGRSGRCQCYGGTAPTCDLTVAGHECRVALAKGLLLCACVLGTTAGGRSNIHACGLYDTANVAI